MRKKIKIIDVLCYISTGDYDKLPKKVKQDERGEELFWNGTTYEFINESTLNWNYYIEDTSLNDEFEILDEEDDFEDIESFGVHYSWDYIDYKNIEELKKYVSKDFQNTFDTLDKLIKNQKKIIERLKDE